MNAPFGGRCASLSGDQREADREGVGEHVRRVREQRQRVRDHADRDLDEHEAEVDQQRDSSQRASLSALTECE